MNHNTDPSSPLPQPDLQFEHYGSQIYLYNLQAIAAAEPGAPMRLYEATEPSDDFQLATLDAKVELTDGGPVLAMEFNAKLADLTDWLGTTRRLQTYLKTESSGRGYAAQATPYETVLRLDLGMGMQALAWFDGEDGRLFVSNNVQLRAEEGAVERGALQVHPVLLGRLPASLQLTTMSRFMADVLDYGRRLTLPPAGPEYHIGERVATRPRPEIQLRLGGAVVAAEAVAQPPALPTPEETLAEVERELPASVDELVRLDEVAGNAELKQLLRNVALSFQHPEVMAQWGGKRPQGVLLHGEPGTGKTMLFRALANEIGAELRALQGSDVYGKWLGESEANIKRFFTELRAVTRPTLAFFDELEAIIGISSGQYGGDSARNGVAAIFKQELNTLTQDNPNVLLGAATNDLLAIDPSLIRSGRFDHVYEVTLPDEAALGELFASVIARRQLQLETDSFKLFASDIHVPELAAAAGGLSGADVVEVFRRLCFARAMHQVRTGEVKPIGQADLLEAIAHFE